MDTNKKEYGSERYDMYSNREPFKFTDFEIDDYTMLMFISDDDSKEEWLKSCKRLKELEKKGIELDRLREAQEAAIEDEVEE